MQFLPSNINNFDFIQNELPETFYEDLLIKEMELSEEFSIEKLTALIKLYSQAMEYYLQTDPPKAKDYQGRMEFLLTNKDTLRKLKKQSDNLTINKSVNGSTRSTQIQEKNTLRTNKTLNEMVKNVEYQTDNLVFDDIMNKVSEVIGDNKGKGDLEATKNLIQKDIEKQNMSWKEKLKHKKKGNLRGSMTFLNKRGANLDLLKSKSLNLYKSSSDEKLNLGGKKLEKMKFMFNDDLYEDVKEIKEENEQEGSDKENNDKNEKEEIIDNLEDFKIVNDSEDEKKDDEKEEKDAEKEAECDKKEAEKKSEANNEIIEEKKEIKPRSSKRKKSIVDKDVTRNVDIDEKILTSVNQKMDLLLKLIDDIEKNKLGDDEDEENQDLKSQEKDENIINDTDNKNQIIIDEKKEKENNILSEIQTDVINIPVKFQSTYYQVESIMQLYMDEFNNFYYKDIFEQFASNLTEIYDNKYKKYIEISIEYHNQIKENEHILENNDNLSEEKKSEIQQIIDSLKDEQQNQIAKIEDEFNRLIVSKVNEFKINSFKNNSGTQLMEEQLKLDIYSLINEAFY